MSDQTLQEKNDDGGGDEEMITITIKLPKLGTVPIKVKKGTTVKDVLDKIKHQIKKGLVYKLNNRMLDIDQVKEALKENENPILENNSHLVIEESFAGGSPVANLAYSGPAVL